MLFVVFDTAGRPSASEPRTAESQADPSTPDLYNFIINFGVPTSVVRPVRGPMAFDYVVVGGGTAGLVIANRLSENPSITVAVIEPGKDVRADPGVLEIELAGIRYSPTLDWNFKSTVQNQLGNRVLGHHAGKALRGTTAINGMYYVRGDRAQYDAWEQLGNPGWNWDTLFPCFVRSEKFTVPTNAQLEAGISYNPHYHGKDGPLKTGFPYQVENGSFHDFAWKTCGSLGFELNQDLNNGETRGFGVVPRTLDRDANVRESAARAYYEPIDGRQNLRVIQGTVRRITSGDSIDGKLVAAGLEYTDSKGQLAYVAAKKEVILSAGTYVSPLILEASGIGNPSVLDRHEIHTKVALPGVGEGFQDQPLWILMFQAPPELTGHIPAAAFANVQDIFGTNTDSVAAVTKAELASWSEKIAERLQGGISASVLEKRFQVQHDVIFHHRASIAEFEFFAFKDTIGMVFSPTLPFSWGSVHLGATGEIEDPAIDPNLLSIEFDMQTALKVGQMARKMWSTEPLSKLAGTPLQPADGVLPENATDEEWTEFLTSVCEPASHCIGTCPILPREMGGVVDSALKVYGTANVRVVDASVMPHQISGHTRCTRWQRKQPS
ncbi:GMC oxidoreductase [Xylariaceae sp. FL0594]|nr:GMC oxidoreductase [Xylariaceae sp. FL0594]